VLNLVVHSCVVYVEVQLAIICVRVHPKTASSGNRYDVSTVAQK